MKKNIILLCTVFIIVGMWQIQVTSATDTAPPDPVLDLRVTGSTDSTLTLSWTAPGDDGMSGVVSSYDLRMAEHAIAEGEEVTAPIVGGEPDPMPGGETQTMTVPHLKPVTLYWFTVKTQDRVGNISRFSNIVTGETKLDTTGPLMRGMKVIDMGKTSARIVWATDEPATSELQYGETPEYSHKALADSMVTEHSLPVGGLRSDIMYHYRLKSVDQYGNASETVNMTFQTLAASALASTVDRASSTSTKSDSSPTAKIVPVPSIIFTPTILDLNSRAAWITAVLKLPVGNRVGLKFDRILLNETVKPAPQFTVATKAVFTRYGTLWLKFRRADIVALVPPETGSFVLTLKGETTQGSFSAIQTLKIINNISLSEWERRQEAKRIVFEKEKQKRIDVLQREIDDLKKRIEALVRKLDAVRGEPLMP